MTTIETLPEVQSAEILLGALLAAFEAGKIDKPGNSPGRIIVPLGGRLLLGYAIQRGASGMSLSADFMYRRVRTSRNEKEVIRGQVAEINGVQVAENDYICNVQYRKEGASPRILHTFDPIKYANDCVKASIALSK